MHHGELLSEKQRPGRNIGLNERAQVVLLGRHWGYTQRRLLGGQRPVK